MKAIVTLMLWVEVDDEEEALDVITKCEKAGQVNLLSVFEQRGITEEELTGKFGYLGASLGIINEEKVMP